MIIEYFGSDQRFKPSRLEDLDSSLLILYWKGERAISIVVQENRANQKQFVVIAIATTLKIRKVNKRLLNDKGFFYK